MSIARLSKEQNIEIAYNKVLTTLMVERKMRERVLSGPRKAQKMTEIDVAVKHLKELRDYAQGKDPRIEQQSLF